MKVIDILNKISKNELPNKTRFKVYSSSEDEPFICEYDISYPGTIWRICDERLRFNYKIDFMRILNYEVEVIEENKKIEELEISEKDRKFNSDYINNIADKLNEVINKINKEREEK